MSTPAPVKLCMIDGRVEVSPLAFFSINSTLVPNFSNSVLMESLISFNEGWSTSFTRPIFSFFSSDWDCAVPPLLPQPAKAAKRTADSKSAKSFFAFFMFLPPKIFDDDKTCKNRQKYIYMIVP